MKKLVVFGTALLLCASAAFATNFTPSIGIGTQASIDIVHSEIGSLEDTDSFGNWSGFLFLDAVFAELDVSIGRYSYPGDLNGINMGFGIYGKYPIALGSRFSLFPMLGVDYQLMLSANHDDTSLSGNAKDDVRDKFNAFRIKAGLGGDFSLTEALYLRGEFLWGFKFKSQGERDLVDAYDKLGIDASIVTHGPTFKIGLGYKI
ncbi:MAG: hypothetical protein LBC62_01075 [Treponema sp.]|jgi:hypothetical protein|nr:hypothetical protein [Treponema sp.]